MLPIVLICQLGGIDANARKAETKLAQVNDIAM